MTSMQDLQFQTLTSDLVPWIADPGAHGVAVTVMSVDLKTLPGEVPATAGGSVRVRADEVLSSSVLAVGDLVSLPAQQVTDPEARDRNAADHWNVLDLKAGRQWLLICRVGTDKRQGLALAAVELSGTTQGEIVAMRAAYELERSVRSRRPDAEAYVRALAASSDTLHRYALDAVVRRQVFGRDQGAALLERAAHTQALAADRLVDAATLALRTGLYAAAQGADPVNIRIVSLIAAGLVGDRDEARRVRWLRLLTASCLGEFSDDPQRDADLRRQLLRAVKTPAAGHVLNALEIQARRSDDSSRALVLRLMAAWTAAQR